MANETIHSTVEDAKKARLTKDQGQHVWMKRERDSWAFCLECGNVRRADGKNKPCKGVVRIALRNTRHPEAKGER